MNIKINKKEIENGLSKISGILSKTDSIFSNFLIDVSDNIYITVSDMESSARIKLDGEIIESGSCLVAGSKFMNVCKKIISENIIFEVIDDILKIKGDGKKSAKYELPVKLSTEYPNIEFPELNYSEIDGYVFKNMVDKTIYSASREDNRYIYNGLLLSDSDNGFNITGTDGRRLSTIRIDKKLGISDSVVHTKFLRELLKNITETLCIASHNNEIYFKSDNVEMSSRLLDGKFPDFEKIIPTSGDILQVVKSDLIDAIGQVLVTAEQPSFQLLFSGNSISCNTPSVGNSTVQTDTEFPFEFGVNGQYLLEALKIIDEEEITMVLKSNGAPIYFDLNDYRVLIMPMKI